MKRILVRAAAAIALSAGLLLFFGCAAGTDEGAPPTANASAASTAPKAADDDGLASPSTAGALRVEGAQLVGEDGRPVQLRGVSTHGLAWFPQYVNQEFFTELRRDWGANVVRLAMYTAESGGYCTDGDQAALERLVEDGVSFAARADLYAIVDWHILSDANPLEHLDEAKGFFARISERFAGNANVIYEICNEPNGSATWADIQAYADEVIPLIRQNAPGAVIVVGTPQWCQRVDEAASAPLGFDNVMYALHFYAATHQQDLRDRLAQAVGAGLPVFVTEFGICDASGDGRIDYDSADAWVRLMDELDVSYVCWNLSNKDEASALFKPGCAKTSGFAEADLSAEGVWLQGVLQGDAPHADEGPDGAGGVSDATADTDGTGGLSFTVQMVDSWEAGGRTYEQYSVTLANDGDALDDWAVTVPFDHGFSLEDSWNGRFSVRGTDLDISNAAYNGAIAAGGSVSDVGFILSY